MSDYERGPVQTYEVVWRSGHVERVLAHQVSRPTHLFGGGLFGSIATEQKRPQRIEFHAEINGRWLLTLSADEADIQTVRLVTEPEPVPDGAP